MRYFLLSFSLFGCTALLASCTELSAKGSYSDHEEEEDFENPPDGGSPHTPSAEDRPGISRSFDKDKIISDEVFLYDGYSADDIQNFLENTPYSGGSRSWIADVHVRGVRASDAIVGAASANQVSPLLLLSRLQVERSAVSKTVAPSQHSIDYSMGCGCPDNKDCDPMFEGFDKQMDCAAKALRRHFDGSLGQSGAWQKGKSKKTLDPISVTPDNHATASLYSYTPWVLEERGGNWLVWKITKKYARALGGPGAIDGPWFGSLCEEKSECDMGSDGVSQGECFSWSAAGNPLVYGFCSISCEGFCPDVAGEPESFCADILEQGKCVPFADPGNSNCSDIVGTTARLTPRFVGQSGVEPVSRTVCVP